MFRLLFSAAAALTLTACANSVDVVELPAGPGPGELGGMCGGVAGVGCGFDAYCAFDTDQYRVADAAGVCIEQPFVCTAEYEPVCGFDGRSYGNACGAALEGVSVLSEGLCPGDKGITAP